MIQLTEQQSRIVLHNTGPAVVFAVAGSGKTTSLVHRIERLIREGIFPARSILATSFSKAAVSHGLRKKLDQWRHCDEVRTGTLHALGLEILHAAQRHGHLAAGRLSDEDPEGIENTILSAALTKARGACASELAKNLDEFDREDFLTWLSCCKANLAFAPADYAALTPAAQQSARIAEPPSGRAWYVELYEIFESERKAAGLITFDDMLVDAWSAIHQWPEVLSAMQGRYECVLVDEYQDINRAQSEILHLLTVRHRNYMAIGDDDQTIYEWRGASPRYILDFQARYGAVRYEMTDNFRSKAQHIVLANRLIQFNTNRERKSSRLTQGFDGLSAVRLHQTRSEMAKDIANEIKACVASGYKGGEVAILVRTYSQVPEIEKSLRDEKISYVVVGQDPFFLRTDIAVLIDYLRLGILERQLTDGQPLSNSQVAIFGQAWSNVYNTPPRYLSHEIALSVEASVVFHGAQLSRALFLCSGKVGGAVGENIRELAAHFEWLASLVRTSAGRVLHELRQRLNYDEFLRAASSNPVAGDGRVTAMYEFTAQAHEKGTAVEFVQHIDSLKTLPADDADRVQVLTIHRAKGAEWPIVIIPDCEDDTIPPRRRMSSEKLEEERRLFYVALTRPKKQLHIHAVRKRPLSRFLIETNWAESLPIVNATRQIFEAAPVAPEMKRSGGFSQIINLLSLNLYIERWWNGPSEQKVRLANIVAGNDEGKLTPSGPSGGELKDTSEKSRPHSVDAESVHEQNATQEGFHARIAPAFDAALRAMSQHELRVFFRERGRYENAHGEMDDLLRPHLAGALADLDPAPCQLEYIAQLCIDYVWSLQSMYPDFWRFTQIPRDRPSDSEFRHHCDKVRARALALHAAKYFETVNDPGNTTLATDGGQPSPGVIEAAGERALEQFIAIRQMIHEYMQQRAKKPVAEWGELYRDLLTIIPWKEFDHVGPSGCLRGFGVFWKQTRNRARVRPYREDEVSWIESMRPVIEKGEKTGALLANSIAVLHQADLQEDKLGQLLSLLLPKTPVHWRKSCK